MDTDTPTQLQLLREASEQRHSWAVMIADAVINEHPITESSTKAYAEARDEYLRLVDKMMDEATNKTIGENSDLQG